MPSGRGLLLSSVIVGDLQARVRKRHSDVTRSPAYSCTREYPYSTLRLSLRSFAIST
jgi:hypothetical protein